MNTLSFASGIGSIDTDSSSKIVSFFSVSEATDRIEKSNPKNMQASLVLTYSMVEDIKNYSTFTVYGVQERRKSTMIIQIANFLTSKIVGSILFGTVLIIGIILKSNIFLSMLGGAFFLTPFFLDKDGDNGRA